MDKGNGGLPRTHTGHFYTGTENARISSDNAENRPATLWRCCDFDALLTYSAGACEYLKRCQ